MSVVWEGDIFMEALENEGHKLDLRSIQLYAPSVSSDDGPSHIDPSSRLRFHAFVDVRRVPFHLVHGPTLGVFSNDADTEEALWKTLVASQRTTQALTPDGEDIGGSDSHLNELSSRIAGDSRFESDVGILLEVENSEGLVSEVLLYAAEESMHAGDAAPALGLVTPPRSSSPTLPQEGLHSHSLSPPIRIFAQPLQSLASLKQFLHSQPSQPSETSPTSDHAYFLPSAEQHTASSQPPHKRPKLDTVFSAASTATRKARRACGASMAQVMAGARPRSGSSNQMRVGSGLSRSLTTGSLPVESMGTNKGGNTSRPGSSRGGSTAHRRGPSLHRIASSASANAIADIGNGDSLRASLPPLLTTTITSFGERHERDLDTPPPPLSAAAVPGDSAEEASVALANKAALSRIVLAALRMWGHAPPSKSSSRSQRDQHRQTETIETERRGEEEVQGAQEEEFKALYHATYSASRFALRHQGLRQHVVPGEAMRGVVERVLGVFLGGNVGV